MLPIPPSARAAVYRAPRQPLLLDHFPIPALNGSEALARVRCATICGSDLHTYFGRRQSPTPCVLGHEMVGEIAATGPAGATEVDGSPLHPGDRVTWSMVWSCGQCFYCRRDLRQKCECLLKFGHEPLCPGRELLGGLAEYCFLPEGTAICRVPSNVPDTVASPANCATATVAAMLRYASDVSGQSVVVYGSGMLGLTACAMAKWRGAALVISIDKDPQRAALGRSFGADATLSSEAPATLRATVHGMTGGRGADVVLELTGSPDATESGLGLLRMGGHFLLAGATYPARPLSFTGEQIVRGMMRITGVYNYLPADLQQALRFLSDSVDRFPFASLVGRTFPLDEVQHAFEYAETERPPRVAVQPMPGSPEQERA